MPNCNTLTAYTHRIERKESITAENEDYVPTNLMIQETTFLSNIPRIEGSGA